MPFFTGVSRITQSKSYYAIIDWVCLGFPKWCIVRFSWTCPIYMLAECYIPIQIIESKDFPLIYDKWSCLLPHLHIMPTKDTVFCVIKEYSVTYLLLLYIVRTASHNAYFLSLPNSAHISHSLCQVTSCRYYPLLSDGSSQCWSWYRSLCEVWLGSRYDGSWTRWYQSPVSSIIKVHYNRLYNNNFWFTGTVYTCIYIH